MGRLVRDTSYSEVTATLEALDRHGLLAEDLVLIRKADPFLLLGLVQSIKQQLLPLVGWQRNYLFTSPEDQLDQAAQWNRERRWGFGENEFPSLHEAPEDSDNPLTTIVLEICLSDVHTTFLEAWALARAAQMGLGASVLMDYGTNDDWWGSPSSLYLLDGIRHERGIRWRRVNLVACWQPGCAVFRGENTNPPGQSPGKRCNTMSPHCALLWCAAFFPRWIQTMNGSLVPFIWLPGYKFQQWAGHGWNVPTLSFSQVDRRLLLSYGSLVSNPPNYAVPEFDE